ncbi:MAG: transglutaminase-like domain-containing protein [Candidatus Woykebacteria bacterium]
MKKAVFALLTSALFIFTLAPLQSVLSASCDDASKIFSSSYKLTFSFDKKGDAKVSQIVSLKNLVSDCFASEYSLRINSTKIKRVSGKDSLGNMAIKVVKSEPSSLIVAKINNEVIGKNKTAVLNLSYTIEDLAERQGLIWYVTVPQIATDEKVTSYKLTITAPKDFGKIFTIEPTAEKISYGKNQTRISYNKSGAFGKNILVNFGDKQEIKFKLKVPFENKNLLSKEFTIFIPPESQKQQILFRALNPRPTKMSVDNEDNISAHYVVRSGTLQQVEIEGIAKVIGADGRFTFPGALTEAEVELYKKGGKYVQAQDVLIQQKAKELKNAQAIHEFVIKYLKFDTAAFNSGKEQRKGAAKLLRAGGRTTNLGFVDLFTALTKAAGIPSREVLGFTIESSSQSTPVFVGDPLNTDKMIVWAQIYDTDKKIWINIDPTWSRTTGADYRSENFSDRVALFYSNSGDNLDNLSQLASLAENIEVTAVKEAVEFKPDVGLKVEADQAFAGFPVELTVTIKNESGITFTGGSLTLAGEKIDLLGRAEVNLPLIFPFEERIFKFKIRAGDLFNSTKGRVNVKLNLTGGATKVDKSADTEVLVKAFFTFGFQQALLFILVMLLLGGFWAPKLLKNRKK